METRQTHDADCVGMYWEELLGGTDSSGEGWHLTNGWHTSEQHTPGEPGLSKELRDSRKSFNSKLPTFVTLHSTQVSHVLTDKMTIYTPPNMNHTWTLHNQICAVSISGNWNENGLNVCKCRQSIELLCVSSQSWQCWLSPLCTESLLIGHFDNLWWLGIHANGTFPGLDHITCLDWAGSLWSEIEDRGQ